MRTRQWTRWGALLALVAGGSHAAGMQVTVWAFGATDKDEATRVSDAVAKVPGVASSVVTDVSADGAKLQVSVSQGDGLALAKAMDEVAGLPLRVEQSTAERVLARMGVAKNARLPFRMKTFETKDKKLGDVAQMATDAVKLLLKNAPFLVEAANPDDARFVFTGRVSAEGKTHLYEVRILRAKSGEISYGKGKGEDGLCEAVQQLVKQLPQRLADLESSQFQKDNALMALPKAMDRARKGLPLRLVKAEGAIDPTRVAQYGASPVATLWLEDGAGKPIKGALARGTVEGLSSGMKDNNPVDLKPGGPTKVPVLAALDSDRLTHAPAPAIAPLEVELSFKQGEFERVATFEVPVWIGVKPGP